MKTAAWIGFVALALAGACWKGPGATVEVPPATVRILPGPGDAGNISQIRTEPGQAFLQLCEGRDHLCQLWVAPRIDGMSNLVDVVPDSGELGG